MKNSIPLIANPAAGRASKKKIAKAVALLKARGFGVNLLLTEKRGDAEMFAKETALYDPPLVVAAGGDGTLNEVANGLAGTAVPMAMLPLGTTNVLAKETGVPENVAGAIEVAIEGGETHGISLGKITLSNNQSRYFCLMAGIGFDSEAVRGVSKRARLSLGKAAFILSGLRALISWAPEELPVKIDGSRFKCHSIIVCNSRKYAGNFEVSPDADISSPHFYVFLMLGKKRIDILRYAGGIVTGRHLGMKDIIYVKARDVLIEGRAGVQLDGDYSGITPAAIEIVPEALRLVYRKSK